MFWVVCGALGIVLGAAYMLWLYQRTMFGKLDNPENAKLKDLDFREIMTIAPIVVCWLLDRAVPEAAVPHPREAGGRDRRAACRRRGAGRRPRPRRSRGSPGPMTPFDPNQLRLIAPEMVLILSAFFVLILSATIDRAKPIWAPGLALLACLATLAAVLGFVWSFGLGPSARG